MRNRIQTLTVVALVALLVLGGAAHALATTPDEHTLERQGVINRQRDAAKQAQQQARQRDQAHAWPAPRATRPEPRFYNENESELGGATPTRGPFSTIPVAATPASGGLAPAAIAALAAAAVALVAGVTVTWLRLRRRPSVAK